MKENRQPHVILIAGPTASGKSQAAIALAGKLGGIVVNADAMQVYRDLSILTARPGRQDEQQVPHHLFGHVDGRERYSVGRWLEDLEPILKDAAMQGKMAIIVGGTGLYFKALCEGLSAIPEIPRQISSHWLRRLKEQGPCDLHAVLMAEDAEAANTIEPGDGQRIVRALAVRQATGKSIRHFQSSTAEPLVLPQQILMRTALLPDRTQLYQRIDERFEAMAEHGALDEVAALLARRLDPDLPVMKAIGVPELAGHLAGGLTLADAMDKAKTNSRRYAKRQMTWIRGQMADWTCFTDQKALLSQCLDLCNERA
ncbi:MAG: tRNA (adenosine(37)-N6)-dimethylallyltransferase MiaA [Aestuariivirgaceae bacterium]